MGMNRCPSCGYKGTSGFSSNHFFVYTCSGCGKKYCFKCGGSNDGRKCPDCASTSRSNQEKVYQS